MLLLALGIPILIASLNVVTVTVPYAFEGPFANLSSLERQQLLWAAGDAGVTHQVTVTVDKAMKPPVGGGFVVVQRRSGGGMRRSLVGRRMTWGGWQSGGSIRVCVC